MAKRRFNNDENILNEDSASNDQNNDSEGTSEDLFGENFMDDYRSDSELDTYDADDTEEEPLSYDAMQRIEDQIQREEQSRREGVFGNEERLTDLTQTETLDSNSVDPLYQMDLIDQTGLNQEIKDGFVNIELCKQRIITFFSNFLNTFGEKKYVKQIRKMCAENEESLTVSYLDLEEANGNLVKLLVREAIKVMPLLDKGLEMAVKLHFPNYGNIKSKLHTRIIDLPVLENIRNLRNCHLNTLIKVNGIITKRTSIIPLLSIVKYNCVKCTALFGPFVVENSEFTPSRCPECHSKGPFIVNSNETIYKDYQKITIQEVPGTVPPGTIPRNKEVILNFDLINKAAPGDEIEVVGIYKNEFSANLSSKNDFPVFFTMIEAVAIINKATEFSLLRISDEDVKKIKELSKKPNIQNILFDSIAPTIYGYKDIKKAIAVSLFGGVRKTNNNHTIRGDINVILLGDPGTAKSQFLRYIAQIMHKAILTTGQGASGVGLTACVVRDPITKEWTLEGGAMVLADSGICLIDEFDKMNDSDRTSIHEAMEQQTVSISKAGIVTSLNARCSVIAAANPTRGRYNSGLSFNQNVNLSDPIISRFDLLCVVKDVIEIKNDERMADFILNTHSNSKNNENINLEAIDQDLLKKYIIYARQNVSPILNSLDSQKLSQLYVELKRESLNTGGLPITVRHIEGILRISEALAKMRLSAYVSQNDIDEAISIVLNSFIGAQKHGVMKSMRRKFAKYLVRSNGDDIALYILNEMFNEKIKWQGVQNVYVFRDDFEKTVKTHGFGISRLFFTANEFNERYFCDGKKIFRASI